MPSVAPRLSYCGSLLAIVLFGFRARVRARAPDAQQATRAAYAEYVACAAYGQNRARAPDAQDAPDPSMVRTDNTPRLRFSVALGEEPEFVVALG